jgi:protein O-GlcNAc transferase
VAASVLNAAGLGELAFGDVEDYKRAVRVLAQHPEMAAGYKRHLVQQRATLPLFDSPAYTRQFEDLLARMWERWQGGQAPEHLPAARPG